MFLSINSRFVLFPLQLPPSLSAPPRSSLFFTQYDEVFALGFVSVFDQLTGGYDEAEREKIFKAYVTALGEDPAQYRADAARLEAMAGQLSGPDGLAPSSSGSELQQVRRISVLTTYRWIEVSHPAFMFSFFHTPFLSLSFSLH
jgi:hypothetical protein